MFLWSRISECLWSRIWSQFVFRNELSMVTKKGFAVCRPDKLKTRPKSGLTTMLSFIRKSFVGVNPLLEQKRENG